MLKLSQERANNENIDQESDGDNSPASYDNLVYGDGDDANQDYLRGPMKRMEARFERTASKAAAGRDSMLYTGSLESVLLLIGKEAHRLLGCVSSKPTHPPKSHNRYRDAFASENDGEVEGHARKDPEPVDIGETRTVEKNISDGKEI